ncbi:MAG TPA: glycosyltransferase family 4 protein [Pyrinomonadaceae bacterium]|nr:glycosyltransferase family 4 protein [Pyrinomonadaceae bacterium]
MGQDFSNKRILLLLPEAFGRPGGIQMFCRALSMAAGRWAKREGASVSAVVLNDGSEPDARYVNGGFDCFAHAGRSKTKFVGNYLRLLTGARYDLVVSAHVSLAPLALLARARGRRVRTAVIAYGVEVWRPLSAAQRAALRRADAVLSISDYTSEELSKWGGVEAGKIRLFPCTLDPFWEVEETASAAGAPPAGSHAPVILSVVRMEKEDRYKGIDSVIESLPMVVREMGAVDYRVVGRGADVPRLKALADRLGVARYVTFAGGLGDLELRDEYRRCSLFVMPSEKEGFGIVFLEAMAYGKAVVGGAHGGTPSVVADGLTGLLVKRSDTAGLALALVRLLGDSSLRERMGRAGRERLLAEFTFDKFESNLDEFLRSSLSQKAHKADLAH